MFAFTMSVEVAEEFWKRVIERKAETEKERVAILLELVNEGRINSVTQTNRTKQQFIKDRSKEFRILDVTNEEGPDEAA